MFIHKKEVIAKPVNIDEPNPQFAQLLLEQFGGATGELYEQLIKLAPDSGTKETLVHLLTREIAHTKMFMKALDSMGKLTDPFFGEIQPDETVDIYYNMSSNGTDERGPWNNEADFTYISDPLAAKSH